MKICRTCGAPKETGTVRVMLMRVPRHLCGLEVVHERSDGAKIRCRPSIAAMRKEADR